MSEYSKPICPVLGFVFNTPIIPFEDGCAPDVVG
jgi:hypothetical protein